MKFRPLILLHFIIIIIISVLDSANTTDLTALLDFKNRVTDDPLGIMATWNDSENLCNWIGITCDPFNGRVTILDLRSLQLVGSLPPSIGNLSFLTGINLRNNGFRGEIPQQLGLLTRLKHLNLTNNMFTGFIPSNLSHCSDLTFLGIELNQFSGGIPNQLCSLSKLEYLGLGGNNLTGGLPSWIGNFSSRFFGVSLALNSFQGSIPPEIGRLSGLRIFQVYGNNFSGSIPSSLYNISSMTYLSVTQNRLHGEIPEDVGARFPNLEVFAGGVNRFTGRIPVSLSNASRLAVLDFPENGLTGTVPSVLGSLSSLYRINFDVNYLDGDMNFISFLTNCTLLEVLGLSYNFFGGQLPTAVTNLSTRLKILTLGGNQMHGNLPLGIDKLVNLSLLGLERNYYTGNIPHQIGKLQNLGALHLTGNRLSGTIPASFGNLTLLSVLHLDNNRLNGSIPSELGNCTGLLELNLSSNNLTGSVPKEIMSLSSLSVVLAMAQNSLSGLLPSEVSKLVNLKKLDVSRNRLSGEVPPSLSSCLSLDVLLMGGNLFQGWIPNSLEALRGLEQIDFSHNNLSGRIPGFLGKLPFVKKLDLSFNDFEGQVPDQGVFSNASAVSVAGNSDLCGGAPSLHLRACSNPAKKSSNMRMIIPVTVTVSLAVVLICSLSLCYVVRKPRNRHIPSSSRQDWPLRISYQEIYKSTNGFSADNLIGSGSFGSVYRGTIDENPVAVKVFNMEQKGASKSFMDECSALKSIRHRNLLKIITACSTTDHQGNEFKCLVSEFMTNGNLDEWLHLHPGNDAGRSLGIVKRLNVAIDVASAIDYLHNYCHTQIVHCDLKPSNILLDEDLTAHVGDFGLARFLQQSSKWQLQNQAASIQLKGSIGYIPPGKSRSHITTL